MDQPDINQDLFIFYSQLIEDPQEIEIIKNILSGLGPDAIIEKFIQSIGENSNDHD